MVALLLVASLSTIPFKLEVSPPRLAYQQRLRVAFDVKIDGREFVKRIGHKELRIDLEITDSQGKHYSQEGSITLSEVTAETRKSDIYYTHSAALVPGAYTLAATVTDSDNGDTGREEKSFHVAAIGSDPLPDAWRMLPAVEFWPVPDAPDRWYMPMLKGHLSLAIQPKRPVKIDVLVNATPTEAFTTEFNADLGNAEEQGSRRGRLGARPNAIGRMGGPNQVASHTLDMNMGVLIPTLRAISEAEFNNASLDVSFLDLARHVVTFTQENVRGLNWPGIKKSFQEGDPNKIDIQSLAAGGKGSQFFVHEVAHRVESASGAGEPPHVLIILSGPMDFHTHDPLHPIEVSGHENCKVFYVRFKPPERRILSEPRPTGRGIPPPLRESRAQTDALEGTLHPLKPRLFDVTSPMDFRKALAELIAEISAM